MKNTAPAGATVIIMADLLSIVAREKQKMGSWREAVVISGGEHQHAHHRHPAKDLPAVAAIPPPQRAVGELNKAEVFDYTEFDVYHSFDFHHSRVMKASTPNFHIADAGNNKVFAAIAA